MHVPSRIQPIDISCTNGSIRYNLPKPGARSRLRRLFGQFPSLSRTPSIEKTVLEGPAEFEPSSVCLANMVRNFIEEDDKPSPGKNSCNCFNGSFSDSSDDELNPGGEGCEILKSLVQCASVCEKNLLADTSEIIEKSKLAEQKVDNFGEIVRDGLVELGYDAAICKSRWERSPSCPAGEYEYEDVIVEGDRLIIDIDFRSQFEIARSTSSYKAILQVLPAIFVGKTDRLLKIVTIVSDAAKQSLKKEGMPFPPWRKAAYLQARWLSPYTRIPRAIDLSAPHDLAGNDARVSGGKSEIKTVLISTMVSKNNVATSKADDDDCVFTLSCSSDEEDMVMVSKVKSFEVKEPKSIVSGFIPIISGNKA